jgi:hypothetical protein
MGKPFIASNVVLYLFSKELQNLQFFLCGAFGPPSFLKRQLSRQQPVNAHPLFGGFGCKGSVDHREKSID